MSDTQLGRLTSVDLREAWKDEAQEFTPWLAAEDNLSLLGEVIGLDLEVEATEQYVGPFRADILCKDLRTGNWVLIENQLEATDHKHLGQLLTYAAGLEAVTIIWIAKRFVDEHRAAIDWLNRITDDRINLFGLEVELWKIGNSALAPKFNIVSKPNEWTRSVAGAAGLGNASETERVREEFWKQFGQFLEETKSPLKPPAKPPSVSFMTFGIGRSSFRQEAWIDSRSGTCGTRLYFLGPSCRTFFRQVLDQKEQIEKEAGESLEWLDIPERTSCSIVLRRPGLDFSDTSKWRSAFQMMKDCIELFDRVFRTRIKNLSLDIEGSVE